MTVLRGHGTIEMIALLQRFLSQRTYCLGPCALVVCRQDFLPLNGPCLGTAARPPPCGCFLDLVEAVRRATAFHL